MAFHVLCFCVDELTESLVPQIDRVVDTLIPFLKWYHDPPVADAKAIRIAAASAMPKILNSATEVVEYSDPEDYDQNMQYVETLSNKVKCALEEASDLEPDKEVRLKMYDAVIMEKARACHVLCFFVDNLTELFVPKIEQVVDTLVPFLKWYHDPPVADTLVADARYCAKAIRIAAASAMSKLVRLAVENNQAEGHSESYVNQLSQCLRHALKEAYDEEFDPEVYPKMWDSWNECKQVLP
ncbi:unnamed protein product [Ilex paraguariensis]|uniref:Uncharacterized protein n=1 Tax=Ilex paraguariensis TaxID=185542 RepID=A0ABC8R3W6_9AQUA